MSKRKKIVSTQEDEDEHEENLDDVEEEEDEEGLENDKELKRQEKIENIMSKEVQLKFLEIFSFKRETTHLTYLNNNTLFTTTEIKDTLDGNLILNIINGFVLQGQMLVTPDASNQHSYFMKIQFGLLISDGKQLPTSRETLQARDRLFSKSYQVYVDRVQNRENPVVLELDKEKYKFNKFSAVIKYRPKPKGIIFNKNPKKGRVPGVVWNRLDKLYYFTYVQYYVSDSAQLLEESIAERALERTQNKQEREGIVGGMEKNIFEVDMSDENEQTSGGDTSNSKQQQQEKSLSTDKVTLDICFNLTLNEKN